MKVLLTGSAGFIGRRVAAAILARGDEVIPFDRPRDIRGAYQMEYACRNADAVINLAGILDGGDLLGAEREMADINILGALTVADAARQARIPMVQVGTGHKGQPNPYAITKACTEDLLLARAQWLGQEIAVVRAYNVYGPGQVPGSPHGPAKIHKFFPSLACRALLGEPMECLGGGGQVIDPVYVDDAAEVFARATAGPYGTVLEAGCGKEVTVRQVAADIREAARSASPVVTGPQRRGEPAGAVVLATRPECLNPWPYLVPETLDWYRQYLEGRS